MKIWKKPVDLEAINAANEGCANDVLGVYITEIGDNFVRSGKVIGTARPLKLGGRMQFWAIDIATEDGRTVCAARLSTVVVPDLPLR
jgi:1,4-dihydroxy-2-naphthoyl-CoA hydrolase